MASQDKLSAKRAFYRAGGPRARESAACVHIATRTSATAGSTPVSYTHLDVYKRQLQHHALAPGAGADQQQRAVQRFLQAGRADRGACLARERAQLAGDMADAVGERGDGAQVFLDGGRVLACLLYTSRCV